VVKRCRVDSGARGGYFVVSPPLRQNLRPQFVLSATTPGEMDIRSILVKTINNEYFSLQDDPERATSTLEEDGCVLLKGSTTLDVCEEAMNQCYKQRGDERCRSEHGALGVDSIMEGITKEVTLNRVLRPIFLSYTKLIYNS